MINTMKILVIGILFLSASIIGLKAESNNNDYTVTVTMESTDTIPDNGETKWRHRMPPRRIVCTISESDGVVIGIDKEEITAFEVWTVEGDICVASFGDESSFVSYLFAISTDCMIRFVTEEYLYTGYLWVRSNAQCRMHDARCTMHNERSGK